MNKQEVVAKIAKDTGITKTAAAGAVESIVDGITRSLKGNSVSFVGFGTFKISNRKSPDGPQSANRRRHQDSKRRVRASAPARLSSRRSSNVVRGSHPALPAQPPPVVY
jgi:nucleoid DNA-binding protein